MKDAVWLHGKAKVDGVDLEIYLHKGIPNSWFSIRHEGVTISRFLYAEPNEDDLRAAMDDFYGVDEWGQN